MSDDTKEFCNCGDQLLGRVGSTCNTCLCEIPPECFDLEAVYDKEIAPLMTQIIAIAKANRMPMFASFNYGRCRDDSHHHHNEGDDMCTTFIEYEGRTMEAYQACVREVRRQPMFVAMTITKAKP